ncbi:unnamed protein product [Rotaria sp. Silwood2]|nr:unnamed protein product [Rotaria sp. Silwood2]CAF2966711.1 unnamed protein product [Rotaria sp. Silwood2]CAF3100433.1 unnamed protein product [Rotaria sp. Silwood2]CAF4107529.1 unnamed protein product [Rotaria sp. Silwood2]CAF4233092.1 unnamed protein product [Rotaria sp. Silwood2]
MDDNGKYTFCYPSKHANSLVQDGIIIKNNEHIKINVQRGKYRLKLIADKLVVQEKYTFRITEANLQANTMQK